MRGAIKRHFFKLREVASPRTVFNVPSGSTALSLSGIALMTTSELSPRSTWWTQTDTCPVGTTNFVCISRSDDVRPDKDGPAAAALSAALDASARSSGDHPHPVEPSHRCDFAVSCAESSDPRHPTVISITGRHSAMCSSLRCKFALHPQLERKTAELLSSTSLMPHAITAKVGELAAKLQMESESEVLTFLGIAVPDTNTSVSDSEHPQAVEMRSANLDIRRRGGRLSDVIQSSKPSQSAQLGQLRGVVIDLTAPSPKRAQLHTASMAGVAKPLPTRSSKATMRNRSEARLPRGRQARLPRRASSASASDEGMTTDGLTIVRKRHGSCSVHTRALMPPHACHHSNPTPSRRVSLDIDLPTDGLRMFPPRADKAPAASERGDSDDAGACVVAFTTREGVASNGI